MADKKTETQKTEVVTSSTGTSTGVVGVGYAQFAQADGTHRKLRLGEILLKHTSLTAAQLEEALKIQAQEGGLLGDVLIRKNMILPHEIMRALCLQIGIPFLDDIKSNEID